MKDIKTLFIGVDGEKVVSSLETRKQIEAVKALECYLEDEGEALTWKAFDDPDQDRTLFQSILRDREMRTDKNTFMADRPSFCVVTVVNNKAVRLEFYEGHDALELVYDLRAKELQGRDISNFMDQDPQAYDPVKFLKDTFGIPEDFSAPILDKAHRKE